LKEKLKAISAEEPVSTIIIAARKISHNWLGVSCFMKLFKPEYSNCYVPVAI
jgi:hypothetical protein